MRLAENELCDVRRVNRTIQPPMHRDWKLSQERSSESQILGAQRSKICWTNYPANQRLVGIGRGDVGFDTRQKRLFPLFAIAAIV